MCSTASAMSGCRPPKRRKSGLRPFMNGSKAGGNRPPVPAPGPITRALEERLNRLREAREETQCAKLDEVMAIVEEFGGGHGFSSQDIDRLLYDERGLPR